MNKRKFSINIFFNFIKTTKEVYDWEEIYLQELEKAKIDLEEQNSENVSYALYYEAGRSFGDISQDSIFHDVGKLVIGVIIMSVYVQLILSKFNWVEWRVSEKILTTSIQLRKNTKTNKIFFFPTVLVN